MSYIIKTLKEYDEKFKKNINCISIDDLYADTGLYLYGTSLKTPFACSDINNNNLRINREFYEVNKEKVQEFVLDTIRNTEQNVFILKNKEFLNNRFINAIISNNNIKSMAILGNVFVSKEDIQFILSSHICHLSCCVDFNRDEELLYQYIPGLEITNYPTVAGVSVMDFGKENVELYVVNKLNDQKLEHLKMLFELYPQEKVYINFKYKDQQDQIIKYINSDKIIIRNSNLYTKEEYIYLNETYDNVYFDVSGIYVTSVQNLILREEIMESIISEVDNFDLSPLERYMYLYNIVKMYKEYKEAEDKTAPNLSRYSEYTLFNDYMVCVGYATLLEELVERLNDKNVICTTYSCSILDNNKSFGHCRCMVKIKDEKYGIDGIYISDPTWDSISYYKKKKKKNGKIKVNYKIPTADIDLYNHFLLTKEETKDEKVSYSTKDASDALFGSNNDNKREYASTFWDINKINKKFNTNILTDKIDYNGDDNTVIPKIVSGETLTKAITNLYSKIYSAGNNDINTLVQNTVEHNILNQYKQFCFTKDKFGIKIKTKKK